MKRYHVDLNQARRVRHAALTLFGHRSRKVGTAPNSAPRLGWAADLHEVRARPLPTTRITSTLPTCWKTPTCRAFSRADQQLLALRRWAIKAS